MPSIGSWISAVGVGWAADGSIACILPGSISRPGVPGNDPLPREPPVRQTVDMHFEAEHDFGAPPGTVISVLCDPEFHTQLDLPDLSRPVVVANTVDGPRCLLRLRYQYVGQLDPIARKVLAGRNLSWIQELRIDRESGAGTLSFSAEADADRLNGTATVAITATGDGSASQRRIAGDLHVRVPLIGGTAERRIVPGLVRRLDVEAAALSQDLASRPRSE